MAVPGKNIIRLDLRKCVENAKCGRKYMTYCRFFAGGGRTLVKRNINCHQFRITYKFFKIRQLDYEYVVVQ